MENLKSSDCSLLYRVQDLLRRKPKYYDVVFSVGPAKKEVKAVRILLEAASPVLEKKFELWEDSVVREESGEGIPLPDFDPEAFEIFVKLTMLDAWRAKDMTNLKLLPNQILNLASICHAFEIKSGLKHLEKMMMLFYGAFGEFENTEEFLRLSHPNLRTILANDNLFMKESDVFECACRWAKDKCEKEGQEANAENLRSVLGDALYEIRFPLMTPQEFTQCVNTHNILNPLEGFEVLKYIVSNETQRACCDVSKFPFKIKPRTGTVHSAVRTEVKTNPPTLISSTAKKVEPKFSTRGLTTDSRRVGSHRSFWDGILNPNLYALPPP